MSFPVWLTQKGLDMAANANGPQIEIGAIGIGIGFGDRGYTPHRTMTALQKEKLRVAISGAVNRGNGHWQITGETNDNAEYPVREVGFYLTDGTLFAIWSHPTNVWFYQTLMNNPIQAFDLILSDVPPERVTVNVTGSLQLFYDSEFFALTIASTKTAATQVKTNLLALSLADRILELEKTQ